MICRICNHTNNNSNTFINNDKMFNSKETFEYFECENCGTLQIKELPKNISDYYPSNYYSFGISLSLKDKLINYVRDWILYLGHPNFLLNKINLKTPNLSLSALLKVTKNKKSKILDVGCGEGKLLKSLYHLGFKNIMGIDPFIIESKTQPFIVKKAELCEITKEKFNIITFNHVLEHVQEVNETLKICHSLLEEKGVLLFRVPVKDSYAFQEYKENWVQWDAPRHYQLLTKKAISILAHNNQFKLIDFYGDGYKFQFTGSEKYKRGLSYQTNNNKVFTNKELKEFTKKAIQLNKENKSDQVVVVFLKN